MIGDILGGVVGGAVVAILHKDGTLEVVRGRPWRHYQGYPANNVLAYEIGTVPFVVEPPTGKGWELLGASWEITTDLTVATRIPHVMVGPKGVDDEFIDIYLPPLVASTTHFHYFFPSGGFGTYAVGGTVGYVFPLPLKGELKDEQVELFIDNGQAGDIHRAFVYYEEFEL